MKKQEWAREIEVADIVADKKVWSPPGYIKDALLELHEAGERDGNEHLAVFRDGKLILRKDGERGMVSMRAEFDKKMFEPGDTYLHNHPKVLNSLSNVDLMLAGQQQGDAYVISADKSIYYAKVLDRLGLIIAGDDFLRISEREVGSILHKWNTASGNCRNNSAHWLNILLSAHGIIDYDWSMQDETMECVRAVNDYLKVELEKENLRLKKIDKYS